MAIDQHTKNRMLIERFVENAGDILPYIQSSLEINDVYSKIAKAIRYHESNINNNAKEESEKRFKTLMQDLLMPFYELKDTLEKTINLIESAKDAN
jgi:HD superfamily phosphohydrolase YqeK